VADDVLVKIAVAFVLAVFVIAAVYASGRSS
jgi:hypothetical protein